MDYLLAVTAFAVWFASSRFLFRRWVRADAFTEWDKECSHGYTIIDKGEPCHKRHPMPKGAVAALAMLAGLFIPVVLVVAGIMWRAPQGKAEMEQRTADLEKENERLRRMVGRA